MPRERPRCPSPVTDERVLVLHRSSPLHVNNASSIKSDLLNLVLSKRRFEKSQSNLDGFIPGEHHHVGNQPFSMEKMLFFSVFDINPYPYRWKKAKRCVISQTSEKLTRFWARQESCIFALGKGMFLFFLIGYTP